ncbi:hypothetical protein BFL35_14735 [Clavibacter michiganensis]|uniref:Uncharacterized protein n=1 Tax=Clavibacter michiganensis TaxID=28447 RepID=A0A251Y9X8_9MICO|nr:hypothetical protein [Clavibacter michiganensis]OUE20909.1 hypothetical protein BFL34_01727 [Clavibacter michiganensis]OUE29536.1 hypothetical protein BFL35_14735 [Clavibacter michiganensis]
MTRRAADPASAARIRTIRRVLVVVYAVIAIGQAVVGVLALTVTDASDGFRALGVVMFVGAAASAALCVLFVVALRRSL